MIGKDITKITINLVVIYVIGGLLLAGVYSWTSPIIYRKAKAEKEAALKLMVPGATQAPVKLGDWSPWGKHAEYYEAFNDAGRVAFIAETYGKGYSSYINILVATDRDFVVQKINVLHHAETPGLGDEITLDWFKDMYVGKDEEHLVVIKGDTEDKIQAITGATISTRAVTNGVRDAVVMLKEKYTGLGAKDPAPIEQTDEQTEQEGKPDAGH